MLCNFQGQGHDLPAIVAWFSMNGLVTSSEYTGSLKALNRCSTLDMDEYPLRPSGTTTIQVRVYALGFRSTIQRVRLTWLRSDA